MESPFLPLWKEVLSLYGSNAALSDSKRTLTYAELNNEILKIAAWLQSREIDGKCVIVCTDDKFESIIAILGILLSGNHYFYLAPEVFKNYESYFTIIDSPVIFKDNHDVDLRGIPISEILLDKKSQTFTLKRIDALAPFAIFSTSGSTGQPKLVRHCHQYILDDTTDQINSFPIGSDDIRDFFGSLMFSASLGAIFPTLLAGAHLKLYPVSQFGPLSLPDFWKRESITMTTVAASLLRILAKSDLLLSDLSQMRIMIVSAESASAEDIALFAKRLPGHIKLMNGYATTETRGIALATYQLGNPDASSFGTVGKPWKGRKIIIEDEEGRELGLEQLGEIVVEAAALPEGYLYNSNENAQAFVRAANGKMRFRTGDMGYFNAHGRLVLKGRKDSVVKINGEKVNLQETESCLNSFNDVRESAVIINKNQRIHAFFSVSDGFNLDTLKQAVSERLMPISLPSGWNIVDELPKTITGKIDRKALLAFVEQESHSSSVPKQSETGKEPLLSTIKNVWKRELEIKQLIKPEDDFFKDLGGNSLLAAVCVDELEKVLDIKLPNGIIFTYSTAAGLEEFIIGSRQEIVSVIPLNRHEKHRPTLYMIPPYPGGRRTYHHLEDNLSEVYNLYFLYYNPILPDNTLVSFDVLTEAFANAMEPHQSTSLLGYSFGGILAYFVSIKLQKSEKKIDRLILLDTSMYKQLTRLERVFKLSERIFRRLGHFAVAPKALFQKYVINFTHEYNAYKANFTSDKSVDDPLNPSQIIRTYVLSFPEYAVLKAEIMLFRVYQLSTEYQFKWDFGWERFTRQPVVIVPLKGWHENVLTDADNAKILVEELTAIANKIGISTDSNQQI